MDQLTREFRTAFRGIRREPLPWVVSFVTLALGIAAATAVFSLVQGILLQPLKLRDAERLLSISTLRAGAASESRVSPLEVAAWRDAGTPVAAFTSYYTDAVAITQDETPERVAVAMVSPNFFDVVGVPLVAGRGIDATTDRPSPAVVVSRSVWRRYFGAEPLRRQTLSIDGKAAEIVGVVDECCGFPTKVSVWRTTTMDETGPTRQFRVLSVLGRVGATPATPALVAASLTDVNARLASEAPLLREFSVIVRPLLDQITGDVSRPLRAMFAAVLLLMLLACFSVANMLMARTSSRHGELAIRAAIGATRAQLARQLLVEGICLTGAAGVAGLVTATWALDMTRVLYGDQLPRLAEVSIDWHILWFVLAMSVVSWLVSVLPAALDASTPNFDRSLRESASTVVFVRKRARMQRGLVAAQCALTVMLLVTAGLCVKSFWRFAAIDPGFTIDRVVVAELTLPLSRYAQGRAGEFYDTLLTRLRAVPGVHTAAATSGVPLAAGVARRRPTIEGATRPDATETVAIQIVTSDYVDVLGVGIAAGRDFTPSETLTAAPVAIVNEAFQKQYFEGATPIGRRIRFDDALGKSSLEIVGVMRDVRDVSLLAAASPQVYTTAINSLRLSVIARADEDERLVVNEIRSIVRNLDAALPVTVRPLSAVVDDRAQQPRARTILFATFASIALVIATIGLVGLVLFQIQQRAAEIGVRLVCGARTESILRRIVGDAMGWALVGVAAGVIGALSLTSLMSSLVYEVAPTDPFVLTGAAGMLLGISGLSAYLSARRSMHFDLAVLLGTRRGRVAS